MVQIDVDDKLVEELIDQTRAKRVEWGFYHWIVFEPEALESLNTRATFSLVAVEENHP